MQFIIQRRKSAKSAWTPTSHVIEADTVNGALRKFGLKDAYKSDKVRIAAGGKTGRQYTAVSVTDMAPTVTAADAPIAAMAVTMDVTPKRSKRVGKATVTVKNSDKPAYTREMRLANLEKARAARAAKRAAATMTVESAHSESEPKRGGARKVHQMTMSERREMRLANARAQAAADRQQRAGSNKAKSLTEQERAALDLLARLDSLKLDVEKLGVRL